MKISHERATRRSFGTGTLVSFATILALGISGCTGGGFYQRGESLPRQQAQPLQPQPAPTVQQQQLPAPSEPQPQDVATAEGVPELPNAGTPEPPKTDLAANAQPVTRQSMVGAWTVSTGGSNCQIFLALTKWSGGYRAASRGCSAPAIADVQAWDVKGKQVVLVNSSGGNAASLYKSGGERFDGSTSGGGAISFTR